MDLDLFRAYVSSAGTQAEAARRLGCSRATVCRIYSGDAPLTLARAKKIEEQTGGTFRAADLLGLGRGVPMMQGDSRDAA